MTIDEAKKNLTAYVYFAAGGIPSAVAQAMDTVVEAVDCTRWIPVSERLPEGIDACNYIASIENYGVDIATYVPSVKEWFCLGVPCKVIAWKPMPEPYHVTGSGKKEESNGQKSSK